MPIQPKLMTAEEALALPDDGMRHEPIDGVLTTMAPTGMRLADLLSPPGA